MLSLAIMAIGSDIEAIVAAVFGNLLVVAAVTFVASEPILLTADSVVVGESELGELESMSWSGD